MKMKSSPNNCKMNHTVVVVVDKTTLVLIWAWEVEIL